MPRARKPARLFLRDEAGKKTWVIIDFGRTFRTGYGEPDEALAKQRLQEYLCGIYIPANAKMTYVYYLTVAGSSTYPVKIGFTSGSMTRRLVQMQIGNPNPLTCLATEVGSQDVETRRHAQFRHLHIRGEWYERNADLMNLIETLTAGKIYYENENEPDFPQSYRNVSRNMGGTELDQLR